MGAVFDPAHVPGFRQAAVDGRDSATSSSDDGINARTTIERGAEKTKAQARRPCLGQIKPR